MFSSKQLFERRRARNRAALKAGAEGKFTVRASTNLDPMVSVRSQTQTKPKVRMKTRSGFRFGIGLEPTACVHESGSHGICHIYTTDPTEEH